MALPFLSSRTKKRDQFIAIDLGARTTKALHLQRKGEGFVLLRYAVLDAPIYEKTLSPQLLGEHLKSIVHMLEAKTKYITLAVGVNDSIIRQAEMPQMPVEDMRQILKNNTKNYLQQDLPNYAFDCWLLPSARLPGADATKVIGQQQKHKMIVGGARQQLIDDLQNAAKQAGLIIDQVVPGLIGPVNALELAMPEIFSKEAAAVIDIGFKSTFICLLNRGEFIMSRVLSMGGDRLTHDLASAMSISYAEAEGIKIGMPVEVQATLQPMLASLGRELRASIDFFEHQQDKSITRVFVSGGSAQSEFIVKSLEAELMTACNSWNPTAPLQSALPSMQALDLSEVAPQLAVAVGAATS